MLHTKIPLPPTVLDHRKSKQEYLVVINANDRLENMYPVILQLSDQIAIQSYGVAIACGLLIAYVLAEREAQKSGISRATLDELTAVIIVAVLVGGRIWHRLSEPEFYQSWQETIIPWLGGYSVMGSTVAALLVGTWYVRRRSLNFWKLFDLVGSYAPLVQGFGRIGCFLAGCCFGTPTTVFWAVWYTDPAALAPQHCWLHPAQLYSAAIFFMLFGLLSLLKRKSFRAGSIGLIYLIGASAERFIVDFWRGDQVVAPLFSVNQWIALLLGISAFTFLIYRTGRHGSVSVR